MKIVNCGGQQNFHGVEFAAARQLRGDELNGGSTFHGDGLNGGSEISR